MSAAATEELRAELELALAAHGRADAAVARVERRPCEYRTSFALEELDVTLAGGSSLRLVFKDLSRGSLDAAAQKAKPAFLHDPVREIEVYRDLLDGAGLGTPAYHGSRVDPDHGRYWLFIENVDGPVLWQVGDFDVWQEAARWLARLHVALAPAAADPPGALLRYGPELYGLWMERALDFAMRPGTSWSAEARRHVRRLADRYQSVVERLAALPATVIHGEFYPSNVLVQQGAGDVRICPIDWEMAATGPALLDLAALTIGKWTKAEREALVRAYREAANCVGTADFDSALTCCRLHLAVQWLGRDPEWVPPSEHRHDWLAEAIVAARDLDL